MSHASKAKLPILIAEDDPDDRSLFDEAFQAADVRNPRSFVTDGEDLMRYLRREGEFAHLGRQALPALLMLDLNMPRKNGREALREIRADAALRHLPIVVVSTSRHPDDIDALYREGANAFVCKPTSHAEFVDLIRTLNRHWFGVAELPRSLA